MRRQATLQITAFFLTLAVTLSGSASALWLRLGETSPGASALRPAGLEETSSETKQGFLHALGVPAGLEELQRPKLVKITRGYAERHAEELAEIDQAMSALLHGPAWKPKRFAMESRETTGMPLPELWDDLSYAVEDPAGKPIAYLLAVNAMQPLADYPITANHPGLFILRLRVHPDHDREKLGALLILEAALAAQKKGIRPDLSVETREGSPQARRFYEDLEFNYETPREDPHSGVAYGEYQAPLQTVIERAQAILSMRYSPSGVFVSREMEKFRGRTLEEFRRYHQLHLDQVASLRDHIRETMIRAEGMKALPPAQRVILWVDLLRRFLERVDVTNEKIGDELAFLETYKRFLLELLGEPWNFEDLEAKLQLLPGEGRRYFRWVGNLGAQLSYWHHRYIPITGMYIDLRDLVEQYGGDFDTLLRDLKSDDLEVRRNALDWLPRFAQVAAGYALLFNRPDAVDPLKAPLEDVLRAVPYQPPTTAAPSLEEFQRAAALAAAAGHALAAYPLNRIAIDRLGSAIPALFRNLIQPDGDGEDISEEIESVRQGALKALTLYVHFPPSPEDRAELVLRGTLAFLEAGGRSGMVRRLFDEMMFSQMIPGQTYAEAYRQLGGNVSPGEGSVRGYVPWPRLNHVTFAIPTGSAPQLFPEVIYLEDVPADSIGDVLVFMAAQGRDPKRLLEILEGLRSGKFCLEGLSENPFAPFPDNAQGILRSAAGMEESEPFVTPIIEVPVGGGLLGIREMTRSGMEEPDILLDPAT